MRRVIVAALVLFLLPACSDSGTDPGPAPASLALSQQSVSFESQVNDDPGATTIEISNSGEGTITNLEASVTYADGQPDGWLTATLGGVTAPTTLTLEATAPPLSGTLEATVAVSSPDAENSPEEIAVSFEVASQPFLYLIRQNDDVLRRLDPVTLEFVDVGPLGVDYDYGDCAWNSDDRTLYVVDGRPNRRLYRVDLATGAAEAVGDHGYEDVFALEYHPPSQTLFGASDEPGRPLLRLDMETGEAEEVGDIERSTSGLAWDSTRESMLGQTAGVAPFGGLLFTVDVETGARTDIGPSPAINNHGLAYDPERDLIWAADVDGEVYRYDPASAYDRETLAENTGQHSCLAYVP